MAWDFGHQKNMRYVILYKKRCYWCETGNSHKTRAISLWRGSNCDVRIALAGEILAKGYFPVIIPVGFIGNSLSFMVSTLMCQPKFCRTCRWNEVKVQSLFWPVPELENDTDLLLLAWGLIETGKERKNPPTQRKLHVNESVWHIYKSMWRISHWRLVPKYKNEYKEPKTQTNQWPSSVYYWPQILIQIFLSDSDLDTGDN